MLKIEQLKALSEYLVTIYDPGHMVGAYQNKFRMFTHLTHHYGHRELHMTTGCQSVFRQKNIMG